MHCATCSCGTLNEHWTPRYLIIQGHKQRKSVLFDLLQFAPHLNAIPGAIAARHKFENDWEISVVSGSAGCGLYGNVDDETYEVAIFRPNGNMTEDVSGWNTKQKVSAMMWVLSQL